MNALVPVHHAEYAVTDIERMARAFAASKLFGIQNADQAFALCLVAQAEGRHPATAAQDYSIIQGRPSKKADAMLRDFLANGGKVQWHQLDNAKADATFTHPAGGEVRIDWTLERAKAAGLANNAMYTKYPRQMLRARCVSEGVRTVCPGATSGMYVPEEVQDFDEPRAGRRQAVAETVTEVREGQPATDAPTPSLEERALNLLRGASGDRGLLKEAWEKNAPGWKAALPREAYARLVGEVTQLVEALPKEELPPPPASADDFGLDGDAIPSEFA